MCDLNYNQIPNANKYFVQLIEHGGLIVLITFKWLGLELNQLRKVVYVFDQVQLIGLKVEPIDVDSLSLQIKVNRLNI